MTTIEHQDALDRAIVGQPIRYRIVPQTIPAGHFEPVRERRLYGANLNNLANLTALAVDADITQLRTQYGHDAVLDINPFTAHQPTPLARKLEDAISTAARAARNRREF